jgi:hypothetical protein
MANDAQRKRMLVNQGAAYRSGLTESRKVVQANLHADVFARSAAAHFALRASTAVGALLSLKSLKNGNLEALVPLLTSGISLMAKRVPLTPLVRGAVVLAAVGATVFFAFKKKHAGRKRAAPQSLD